MQSEFAELRDKAMGEGKHARTPGIMANLALGLKCLLEFAHEVDAISDGERSELWRRGWAAIAGAAAAQADQLAIAEPAGQFMRLLQAALASGYAHVADQHGDAPPEPRRWGWRLEGSDGGFKCQGTRVGWLSDGELYVEPDASYAVIQRFARDQGESFTIAPLTLRRRLKENDFLATVDTSRSKLTVRRSLQGSRHDVLHLVRTGAFSAPKTSPTGPEGEFASENGSETRSDPWEENGEPKGGDSPEMAAGGTPGRSERTARPEMGRTGQLHSSGESPDCGNNPERQATDWGPWQ
jgi:hypothetical protein